MKQLTIEQEENIINSLKRGIISKKMYVHYNERYNSFSLIPIDLVEEASIGIILVDMSAKKSSYHIIQGFSNPNKLVFSEVITKGEKVQMSDKLDYAIVSLISNNEHLLKGTGYLENAREMIAGKVSPDAQYSYASGRGFFSAVATLAWFIIAAITLLYNDAIDIRILLIVGFTATIIVARRR